MNTFGIEAEYQAGAPALAAVLAARGLSDCDDLHGYHCACPACADSHRPFKAQSDSTCSGEIVSDILVFGEPHISGYTPEELLRELQSAAVDADAEPGPNSGFHVHVGRRHLRTTKQRADALWAFLRWEPALEALATGRFSYLRQGMNRAARLNARNELMEASMYSGMYGAATELATDERIRAFDGGEDTSDVVLHYDLDLVKMNLLGTFVEADRHCHLNLDTPYPTWEFRLWNSTRSAWRMEMFARVSLAFMDIPTIGRLLTEEVPRELGPALGSLRTALDAGGAGRAAELVDRQLDYLPIADKAPESLSVFE